jgi:hypothetical protein
MNPLNFLKIHLNIILLSTSWSPQWLMNTTVQNLFFYQLSINNYLGQIFPSEYNKPRYSYVSKNFHCC